MKRLIPLMMLLLAFTASAQKLYKSPSDKKMNNLPSDQLQAKATAGDPMAMTCLAQRYQCAAFGMPLDSLRAFDLIKEASAKGYEKATLLLADHYVSSGIVQHDTALALRLVTDLVAKGSAMALSQYGDYCLQGIGVPVDTAKALDCYRRSADCGEAYGYTELGLAYLYGFGSIRADESQAIACFEKAAAAGFVPAQSILATIYLDREEFDMVQKYLAMCLPHRRVYSLCTEARMYALPKFAHYDLRVAESKLKDIIALYPNDPQAIFYLALLYDDPNKTSLYDPLKAFALYERGAELKDVNCLLNLGVCYLSGQCPSGLKDEQKAVDTWERAFALNPLDARPLSTLSVYYFQMSQDEDAEAKALSYADRAIAMGDHERATAVGVYYARKGDNASAEKYLLKAARMGNIESYGYLFQLTNDPLKEQEYASLSLQRGHRDAYYYLFICTLHNQQDAKSAIKYLRKGEKINQISSILTLGDIYRRGDFGKQDLKKALAYYEKAGKLGSGRGYYQMAETLLENAAESQESVDYFKVIDYLNKAIELDYDEALYRLGTLYEVESNSIHDYAKSLELFSRLADKGDPRGDFKLGLFYELGDGGLSADSVLAVQYYQKAADAGYSLAKCYLADFYKLGRYLPLDERKAFELYSEAAEEGAPEGAYFLGKCYLQGVGTEPDTLSAVAYMREAAQVGVGKACAYMGNFFSEGVVLPNNLDSAIHYYYMGSQDDDTTCDYNMGLYLQSLGQHSVAAQFFLSAAKNRHGMSVYKIAAYVNEDPTADPAEATRLLHVATTYGISEAYVDLGVNTVNGRGCQPDMALAKSYFDTAAMMGNGLGMFDLAMCYQDGIGCDPDTTLLLQWLQASADKDNINAINRLGDMYEAGDMVPIDLKKAFSLYEKGVELGSPVSMCNLGYCYEKGEGCVLNSQRAFELYSTAAEMGDDNALYMLANCYMEGIFVQPDAAKAVEYLQKAAELGHLLSLHTLGVIYENGEEGIAPNRKLAVSYYSKAAELGFEPSASALKRIKNR